MCGGVRKCVSVRLWVWVLCRSRRGVSVGLRGPHQQSGRARGAIRTICLMATISPVARSLASTTHPNVPVVGALVGLIAYQLLRAEGF